MIIDTTGNVVNNIDDVLEHFLSGGSIDSLQFSCYDQSVDLTRNNDRSQKLDRLEWIINERRPYDSIQDMDQECLNSWLIPPSYKKLNIAEYIISRCSTDQELERVGYELEQFAQRDLLDMLCAIKFLVDVMEENDILWGVGRGSSVASYCLYLLRVHSIDSIKYGLDFEEFL